MSKIDLKTATVCNGMMIVPGSRPNSLDKTSPLHPRNGAPKNFAVADREHGFIKHDRDIGVVGASHGMGHHPDASMGHGVPVHPGMLHVNKGTVTAGISKTQKAFDDEPNSKLILRDHAADAAELETAKRDRSGSYHKYPPIAALNGRLPATIKK